jgi:hypothetical protein
MTVSDGTAGPDEAASGVAIEALSYIASDPLLFNRFLRLTGLELENIRQAAGEPLFLAGVLDFILNDEKTLDDFAAYANIPPQRVAAARRTLAPEQSDFSF